MSISRSVQSGVRLFGYFNVNGIPHLLYLLNMHDENV